MRTRRLGDTDLDLTTIGLGTWAIGGGDWGFAWGAQDEAESIGTIHDALELGINWIDTAPVYGLGTAETVVGKALAGVAERPIIATKCGRTWRPDRSIEPRIKKDSIKRECEESLSRLGVDVIDLYQIHWPEPNADVEEAWNAVGDLKAEGKIRWCGVSNFSVSDLERIHSRHPVASLQPPYSMLRRDVEEDVLPWCAKHGVGVVAYSPMQKGLLTGKMTAERVASLPEDDHRRRDPMFLGERLSHANEMAMQLAKLGEPYGLGAAAASVAWVLRRPEVTSAIVGARRPGQLAEIVGASEVDLPA
ncbi:MAG: aldo/keto reductase [Planctomycetota bacterium]|nr:aldo/keto reductase [Planctomycetota bacterium]